MSDNFKKGFHAYQQYLVISLRFSFILTICDAEKSQSFIALTSAIYLQRTVDHFWHATCPSHNEVNEAAALSKTPRQ